MSKSRVEFITLNKPNIIDFAKERNNLLDKSKSEWVFFVDSDEVLSDELKKEMAEWLDSQIAKEMVGCYVNRENYFLGYHIGTDKILRLIKKGSGQWERPVHEVFHLAGGNAGELKNPLIHNTAKSLHEYITKINYYAHLHALANKMEKKRSGLFKIIFYPLFKFVQSIVIKRGVVFSILQAFHSFLAWSELWLLNREQKRITKYE